MQDEKIFKMAVITTIIGLIGVILLTGYVNPEQLTINKIDKSKLDNNVEITATINKITTTKSGTEIITLNDETGSINLVIFPTTEVNKLNEGDNIRVVAQVSQYKGQIELILEESNKLQIIT